MATKEQKRIFVDEIKETLKKSGGVYIAEYNTMNVKEMNVLRKKFREQNVTFKVYKNKLVQLAMKELGGYDAVFPLLERPCGYAFAGEELSLPAKILKDVMKELKEKPKFKAAIIDGSVFGADSLEALTTMKSKNDVIGEIIGLLQSPLQNVIAALQAQGSNIVGAVKTIAEKE